MIKTKLIIPQHIGFITDGNRRWAKMHKLPTDEGHAAGSRTLETIIKACGERGVKTVTVYALSSENRFSRTRKEITDLMRLFKEGFLRKTKELQAQGASLSVLGEIKDLPLSLQKLINRSIKVLKNNERIKINIALNYGGRPEIVQAVKKIISQDIEADKVNEELISRNLYTNGQPDPDLVIRTGGELRLSNFLLWQSSYSELYFTTVLWPDFSAKDLDVALADYTRRKRNFGH